jgi:butyrate kinase
VARQAAKDLGRRYEEVNFIVVHLGGGISVGAHRRGKIVDVNNALNGDGPFAPERAGGLPAWDLVELCFSGRFTKAEIKKLLAGKAG